LVASRRLRFNPLAEAELQDAASWYDERVAGLGGRFITAIRHRAGEIVESPRRWPLIRRARRVLVGPYPYAIIYREISDEEIEIVAVAHLKRRPDYWAQR
jgi:plasmid stabilization system protein ParE